MEDSLIGTSVNRRAKFDAASFILGGEISNRTNKQTKLQTVNDISTPCLSACVDNKRISCDIPLCYHTMAVTCIVSDIVYDIAGKS